MYRQIARNKRWSVALIVFFCLVLTAIGVWLSLLAESPLPGILLAAFTTIYVWRRLHTATRSAARAVGCREVTPEEEPRLHRAVSTLAIRTGQPMPAVCVIDEAAPNAFAAAMSPDDAVIGVTRGALDLLDDTELHAVVAHEMAHIVNYDSRMKITTFALVGAIAALAAGLAYGGWAALRIGLSSLRSPIGMIAGGLGLIGLFAGAILAVAAFLLGPLITAGVSRQREYLADASAAELTRYPDGLARALATIEQHSGAIERPAAAASSLYFANPLRGGWLSALLDSHPSTAKRIQRLEAIGRGF